MNKAAKALEEAKGLADYYNMLLVPQTEGEESNLQKQHDLLARYFAMEVAAAVANANTLGHGNVNNLIIKQTGDIRALMLGYLDPAVNENAEPGTTQGPDNSTTFLDKCKEALHDMLSRQSTGATDEADAGIGGGTKEGEGASINPTPPSIPSIPSIEWDFLTNKDEAELEMERWVVELNELNEPSGIDKIVYSTGVNEEDVTDGYVMVNIGSSSTQIGVVKKVLNGEQESFKLTYSNGINYCGAKDASFGALEAALTKVLEDAYTQGGRHFIFRNAIGYAFNKFKTEDFTGTEVKLTPSSHVLVKDKKGKDVSPNIVHLNQPSYNSLVRKQVHNDIKIFLKGCSSLMGKEGVANGVVTLNLIPAAAADKKHLFDPQWAYSVITRKGGRVDLTP